MVKEQEINSKVHSTEVEDHLPCNLVRITQKTILKNKMKGYVNILDAIYKAAFNEKYSANYTTNEYDLFYEEWSDINFVRKLGYTITLPERYKPIELGKISPYLHPQEIPGHIENTINNLKDIRLEVIIGWKDHIPHTNLWGKFEFLKPEN